jgi:lysophospholipase L1-like esterase
MRQLFISYARENKPDVEALTRDLDALGYQTWVDSSLRGGQTWWEEILRRIAESDVFVAIVSAHTLNSVACKRELEWALALNKPVLPVAVERLPQAVPLTLSMRQIVDYSKPGKKAAFALAGALGTLPAEPPAPEQLPEPPPAPLSYLSDLVECMGQPEPLTHAQQHQILIQLQPALRSADPEEREGGRYVLTMFSRRDDLYADVDRTLAQLGFADHLDVAARLQHAARTAQRRKALVDEMTALHQAGQWDAVVAAAQELAGLDPEHPDPGGIVSDAKAKIRHADFSEWSGQAWQQAVDLFSAIEQEQPGYRDAAALLKTAEQQRDLATWLDQAEAAAGDDDWDTAVTALENLCAVDPAYEDAGARLEQARSARSVKQLRLLVDEMTALHQAGRWKEVLAGAEKLAQLDPDHPDPGGIVSDAQAKIRDAQLAEQYAQALNHLDRQHWQQAAEMFTAIEQEQPGYRDAAALLKTAQQNLRETAVAKQRATTPAKPPPQTTTPAAPEKTTPYPQKTTPSPAEKEAAPAALEAPVAQSASLTHEQQGEIIDGPQRALISGGPQNRQVVRHLLDRFSGRQDLYQDISRTVAQWRMELSTIQGVQRVVAVATVIVAVVVVGVLIARDSGGQQSQTVAPSAPATTEIPSRTPGDALQAVVIGDEFASGTYSGGFGSKNWTVIMQGLAAQSGIDVYVRNFSRSFAGYAATYPGIPTFGEQVARGVNPDTNLVILVGGGNDRTWLEVGDTKYSAPALHDAVVATLDHVKSIAPQAGMLVVGPIWCRPAPLDDSVLPALSAIRRATDEAGVPFIDPIGEDWFAGRDDLVSPGKAWHDSRQDFHLNNAGHQVIAERLAEPVIAALRRQHPATAPSG